MPSDKKIGGEFGEVRANIDVVALSAYLLKNVKVLRGPIDVKQFKVSAEESSWWMHTNTEFSLGRYATVCVVRVLIFDASQSRIQHTF